MVCGVSLILQNATCSAEAACPKDVVQGRQWKSNYSLRRPYDLTEGFPVLVCAVDIPCSDTVCEMAFVSLLRRDLFKDSDSVFHFGHGRPLGGFRPE